MKKYKDWHMYGSVALLIGIAVSAYSGIKRKKTLHVIGALIGGIGTGVCIYSGHKILGGCGFAGTEDVYGQG